MSKREGSVGHEKSLPPFMDKDDQAAVCPAERAAIARANFMVKIRSGGGKTNNYYDAKRVWM